MKEVVIREDTTLQIIFMPGLASGFNWIDRYTKDEMEAYTVALINSQIINVFSYDSARLHHYYRINTSYTISDDVVIEFIEDLTLHHNTTYQGEDHTSHSQQVFWSLPLICDGDAPQLKLTMQTSDNTDYADSSWTSGNVKITLFGSDATSGLKGYQVSTDGEKSWADVTENVYTVSTEGINTLSFRAVDNVGNTSEPQSRTVKIDRTPPVLSIPDGYNSESWSTNAVTYSVGASDAINTPLTSDSVSGLERVGCVDNTVDKPFSGTNPYKYDVSIGRHSITFYAVDKAGNSVSAGPYTVNVDTGLPTLSIVATDSPEHDYTSGTWTNKSVSFTLYGNDTVSGVKGFEYKLREDGSGIFFTDKNIPDKNTYKAESTRSVWFRPVDNAGNYGAWNGYSVNIDTLAPGIKLDMGTDASGGVYYLSADTLKNVTCSCSDRGGSGIEQQSCSVDGALPVIYSTMDGNVIQNCIAKAGTGKHTYTLLVTDKAGNSTSESVTVLYDDSAVSGGDTGLALGDAHHAGTVILEETNYTADITDAVPAVRVQTDGGAQGNTVTWTLGGKTFSGSVGGTAVQDGKGGSWYTAVVKSVSQPDYAAYIKSLADGEYEVNVTVTDWCGNTGKKLFVLTKDTVAPKPVASWLSSVAADAKGNVSCTINLPAGTEKTSVYQFKDAAAMNAAAGKEFAGESPVYSNSGTEGAGKTITSAVQGRKAGLYLAAVDGCGNYEKSVLTVTVPDVPAAVSADKVVTTDMQKGTASFYLTVANPVGTPSGIQVTDINGNVYTVTYKTVYKCIGLKGTNEKGINVSAREDAGGYIWTVDDLKAAGAWGEGTERRMHIRAEYSGPTAAGAAGTNPADVIVMLNREGPGTVYAVPDSAPVFCAGDVNWPEYIGSAPGIGWVSAKLRPFVKTVFSDV